VLGGQGFIKLVRIANQAQEAAAALRLLLFRGLFAVVFLLLIIEADKTLIDKISLVP
jgi:hypothetical protein